MLNATGQWSAQHHRSGPDPFLSSSLAVVSCLPLLAAAWGHREPWSHAAHEVPACPLQTLLSFLLTCGCPCPFAHRLPPPCAEHLHFSRARVKSRTGPGQFHRYGPNTGPGEPHSPWPRKVTSPSETAPPHPVGCGRSCLSSQVGAEYTLDSRDGPPGTGGQDSL